MCFLIEKFFDIMQTFSGPVYLSDVISKNVVGTPGIHYVVLNDLSVSRKKNTMNHPQRDKFKQMP